MASQSVAAARAPHDPPCVDRGFVRIREGQIHYRTAGPAASPAPGGGSAAPPVRADAAARPLWMIHASPASSLNLVPLLRELARSRRAYAPDTPGNGDSEPLGLAQPEMPDYADAAVRTMDALGLDRVDLYGSHTGAHVATEIAIAHPDRVGALVLDGISFFEGEERREILERYAPEVRVDAFGSQLWWAWHFVRDQCWFFPYFRTDAVHNRGTGLPSPQTLHGIAVEVLKAIGTYHLAYRAAFRHEARVRLPLVRVPTLSIADESDPLKSGVEEAARLVPGARHAIVAGEGSADARRAKARLIADFVDGVR